MLAAVPDIRIDVVNDAAPRGDGDFVLYWMIAFRRTGWNFALQRALAWAHKLRKPLVILEALRCDYPWACDRLHRFFLDGMADNAQRLHGTGVLHYAYVEPRRGAGKGLLAALARNAGVVVTDEYPCTFLPRMTAAGAAQCPVRFERIDSNGLLPLRAAQIVFPTAYAFRRFLHRELPPHLEALPEADPLAQVKLPALHDHDLLPDVTRRWPPAAPDLLTGKQDGLAELPLDHNVRPTPLRGGAVSGHKAVLRFLTKRLPRYADARNVPEQEASSGLSPYLHFGHVSPHQVFAEIAQRESWSPARLSEKPTGRKEGWWGLSAPAAAFLDELITWRELGFNLTWQRDDYDRFESLPAWAQRTLEQHAADAREHTYSLAEFETSATHDPLWNAAQKQLVHEGIIHNYLRMLWGKKILEWTASPREALAVMIELNNKYGLDGRDPNSYSGIGWVLGRYDRPWGPERPIFGTVRYMSSANTARKVHVENYIQHYLSL